MKTTYLIWKDPNCGGINPDWQEINGQTFLSIVRSTDSPKRFFIKLGSTDQGGSDGAIVMEATESVYREWKREKNRADYLRSLSKDYITLSYHCLESDDGSYGEELLRDESADTESDALLSLDRQALAEALSVLTDDEHRLINYLYLSPESGTERGYTEVSGLAKTTVHDLKVRAFKKLKKFFED